MLDFLNVGHYLLEHVATFHVIEMGVAQMLRGIIPAAWLQSRYTTSPTEERSSNLDPARKY